MWYLKSEFCEVKDKVRYNNCRQEITWAHKIFPKHTRVHMHVHTRTRTRIYAHTSSLDASNKQSPVTYFVI